MRMERDTEMTMSEPGNSPSINPNFAQEMRLLHILQASTWFLIVLGEI
jgi:hypothetical protein